MRRLDVVTALLRGERTDMVLHNCRLQAFGREQFGVEAIAEAFGTQPHEVSDGALLIETPRQLALFDDTVALVADVYDGRLGRLWRLGPGHPSAPEPQVDVPFDVDCHQTRGDVVWQPSDHPELAPAHHAGVVAAGRQAIDGDGGELPAYRARAFVLRAFGEAGTCAALFALYRISGGETRTGRFGYVAARVGSGRTVLVGDPTGPGAGAAFWRPRI